MPKDIDIKRVLDTKWRLSATQGLNSRGEPQNLRRDALQDFENKTASMQNRKPRKVVVYTSDAPPPPVQGDAEEVYYVKDKVLKSAGANLPYSLAAEMLTDQFRPEKWSKLSTDGKIKTIELLEQSMGLQQTLKGAAKPQDARPRSVEVITGAGLPPYKFSADGSKIQIDRTALEKPENSSLGLDLLDALAIQQIACEKWNGQTPETRLSNLQLAECGMAARQGRVARRVTTKALGAGEFGYYDDEKPYRLTVSRRFLRADVDMDFITSPLNKRKSDEFPNLETLDTVLHEGRHATQYDLLKGYLEPAYIGQKPEVKDAWKTNMTGYITGDFHPFSAYRYQPIEADANNFAGDMIFNHLSGALVDDPTYTEYLNIKRKEHARDSARAERTLGVNYLDKSAEIARQEEDALTSRLRAEASKQPGSVTEGMLTEFAAKMAVPGISMETLSNDKALKSTEQYKSAAHILENTLLSDEEKKLPEDKKDEKLKEKLKQLHFGGCSFEDIYAGKKKSGWTDGSEVVYAAALMTEVMDGKSMVSPENQMPQTVTFKTGSFYTAVQKQEMPGTGVLACNEKSKRQAVADGFREASAGTGQPSVNKEEGAPYGFAADGQMSKEQLSVARGLLLNQGYKLSDILDPGKLQYAKEIAGKAVSLPIATQKILDSMTGYMNFNLHSEMGHINGGLHSEGDFLTEFADIRYQPQLLRVMSEFSGSFNTTHDLLKKDITGKANNYLLSSVKEIENTSKLVSLLQPDRIKDLYDYYSSQEYLDGRTSASGKLETKAAEASFVLQETVMSYGENDACTQPDDLSVLLMKQSKDAATVTGMDSSRKAQYIQSNERIQEALGKFTADEKAKAAAQQKADETAKQAEALEKQRMQDEKIREEKAMGEDMASLFDMGPLPVQAPPPQVSPAPTIPPPAETNFQKLMEEEQRQKGKAEVDSITKPEPVKVVHKDKKPVSIAHKP